MKSVKDMKVRMRRTWGPAVPGANVGGALPTKAACAIRGSRGSRRQRTAHVPAATAAARSGVFGASH